MNKIKTVKIKNLDGSVSEESYAISVDAKNVDMDNGKDLQDTVGNINVDRDGNIAEQLAELDSDKINITDIIDNLNSTQTDKVLSANQGKVLGDAVAALEAENIKKKAYFFDTVADMKAANLKNGDYAFTGGYYEANDGGGALYYITEDVDPSQHQEELDSGLYATLIVNNDTKNIKLILNNNKFKPQVSASMYTLDHNENAIKNRILKWKEMGVKGIIVLINLDNDESLTILDDLVKTKNLMIFAKENGLNVNTIKFHCLLRDRVDSTTLNTYYSQVISVLDELNAYQFGIRRITLFNELPYIYGPLANSTTKNNAITIINNIKSLGYSVGITCSNLELGIGYMIQYSPNLCEAVDFFAFNYYQIFPFKKELTTYDDSIFAWDKALDSLYTYKQEYPDKDIILSETGCLDNWLNMMNPADFTLNQYPANGQTYPIYFYGLLNNKIANNDLKEVWLWYDEKLVDYDAVIDYFKYYLGGNSND